MLVTLLPGLNVSQFPTTFRIRPEFLSMAYDTLRLPPVAYLFGKISVLWNSEKSVLSSFSENVGALPFFT